MTMRLYRQLWSFGLVSIRTNGTSKSFLNSGYVFRLRDFECLIFVWSRLTSRWNRSLPNRRWPALKFSRQKIPCGECKSALTTIVTLASPISGYWIQPRRRVMTVPLLDFSMRQSSRFQVLLSGWYSPSFSRESDDRLLLLHAHRHHL